MRVATGLIAVLSVGLMFAPQLNLLNYFFSIVIAAPLTLAVGLAGIHALRKASPNDYKHSLKVAGSTTGILVCVPLLVVTIATIFVTNCDYFGGLAFYAMGPALGAVYAALAALVCTNAVRTRWAYALFVAWWIGSIILNVAHFYTAPQIFAYNPFLGFFSGTIYDEFIEITDTYAYYRVYTLVQAALLFMFTYLPRQRRKKWIALALLVLTLLGVHKIRSAIGFEVTREHIAQQLGAVKHTDHFEIYYDSSLSAPEYINHIADEHEYRYEQLKTLLKVEPKQKIKSFIYGSRHQKRTLMGADQTYIAKPWLYEIHLNSLGHGAPVLKHEMAHVFGAELSEGWLKIPTQGLVVPQMALVEGFAVAATWFRGRLTLHQWSAAMRELGFAPSVLSIFNSTQFVGTHAGMAYTLSGSFLHFLLERYGIEKLQELYAGNGLETTYGQSPEALETAWGEFVDDRSKVPLTARDLNLARFRFDVPSVFHRVCALEVAKWERQAQQAAVGKRYTEALELFRKVQQHDPKNPNKLWPVLGMLIKTKDLDEALALAHTLAQDDSAGNVLKIKARGRAGDILWLMKKRDEAAAIFKALEDAPLPEPDRRSYAVRAQAVQWDNTAAGDAVRDYLMSIPHDTKAMQRLSTLAEDSPDEPILWYLLARRQYFASNYLDADLSLAKAIKLGLKPKLLERESHKLRGLIHYMIGKPQKAIPHFEKARSLFISRGFKDALSDWIERCNWKTNRLRLDAKN